MELNNYKTKHNQINKEINSLESKSFQLSILRLISGVGILFFLLSGYFMQKEYHYLFSLLMLLIFIILVSKHTKIKKRLTYLKANKEVVRRYLARFDQGWKEFLETGLDYVEKVTGVMKDLDLVGQNSLFQYLNTAATLRGKKRLLAKLTRKTFNQQLITQEQAAIKELSQQEDLVIKIETYGQMLKTNETVIENFVAKMKFEYKSWRIFKYLIPMMTITVLIMFLFDLAFKFAVIMLPVLIFGQWLIAIININKNSKLFQEITQLSKSLTSYRNICQQIEQVSFTSVHLNELKRTLAKSTKAFNELNALSGSVKQRNNLLAFILLNGVLLWDINCVERYYSWVDIYGKKVNLWLEAIGEIESLISLQVLLKTKDKTTFAVFDKTMCLEFHETYHPLIETSKVVANSFTMDKQVCVITGSNMSGKTTFLRTIGINLVLAYAGGPVMANYFKCSLMNIYTSMRIEDDLKGISSFYAELLRIKEIVEANRQGNQMIALIDEIFKGTNSKDRIIGASETVKQLSTPNIFTFITTHDFELCELENQVSCSNYHFNEDYQDNEIVFDYLIKTGKSKTTNAQYLLRMVGIIK